MPFVVYVVDGLLYAFTAVTLFVSVAQFEGFIRSGRSSGGNRGPTHYTVFAEDFYFDSGIAPRIENFPAFDFLNFHNVCYFVILI